MRRPRLFYLSMMAAALLSAVPLLWLAVITYSSISNIEYFGWFDGETAGYFLAAVACWSALLASVAFCVIAWDHGISHAFRIPWIMWPLIAGVGGDLVICWLTWNSPKLWFPPTFFMWPAATFIFAGLLRKMLPNPALNTDAERPQRAG